MEENSVGDTGRIREDDDSDTAMSVASNAQNAESFRKKCEDLWDETEPKGKGARSRSNSRSKSRGSSRSKSSSRSRSVSRSRSRSVSSRSSRSFSSKSSGKSRTSSRSSIKSRSSVISRSSSKSMSDKNCDVAATETNCVEKEKEKSGSICDKGGDEDSKEQAGGERKNGPVHKNTESIHLETESVHLEDNSDLDEGNEESCSVDDLKIDNSGPSLIDTFDVKDGPPEPHYDVEEDEQTFPNLNPMDYVTKEDDDPECPKDIEIPYDDREAMLDHKKDGEAVRAALESLGDQVVGGTLSFGQKMLEVRLPNFKYKAKHLNKSGGFPLAKLKGSHPSFFMKQSKQNAKKPEKLVSAKSTGGGFSAKAVHKPTDTDDEDIELNKKLKEMDEKNAKKQQKIFKEDKILSSKHKSKAKVSSDSSSDSDADVKTPEYETAPPLQQVKIKDLEIRVERMDKTLVEEKHKLFMEVEERELKLRQEKEKQAADKKATKETAKTKQAEAKNDDKKFNDSTAKLAKKYNVSLSTSEESNDSDSKKVAAPKLETNSKKKVLTKKKPRKSKSSSSDESEDESKSSKELFTNPFFVNDDSEGGKKKISEETEKEKLVEMLYSLIKKDNNSDKTTPESSPTKPKEKLPAVNKKDEKIVKNLSDIKSEDEKSEKPTLDSQESLEKKSNKKSASKDDTVSAKIDDKSNTEEKSLSDKKSVEKSTSGNSKNFLDLLSDSDSDSDANEINDTLTIVSTKKGEKTEKDAKKVMKDSDSDDSDVPSKTVSRRHSKEETSGKTGDKVEKDVKEVKKDSDSDDSDVPSKTVSRRPSKEETSSSPKKIPKKASKQDEVDNSSDDEVNSSRKSSKDTSVLKKTPKQTIKQKGKGGKDKKDGDAEVDVPSSVSSRRSSKEDASIKSKKTPKKTSKQKEKNGKDLKKNQKDSDSEANVPSPVSSRRSSIEDASISSKKIPKKTSKKKGKTKKDSDSETNVPSLVSSRRSSIDDASISSKKTPKKTSKQKGKAKIDSDSEANVPSPVSSRRSSIDDASISSKKTPKKVSKQKDNKSAFDNLLDGKSSGKDKVNFSIGESIQKVIDDLEDNDSGGDVGGFDNDDELPNVGDDAVALDDISTSFLNTSLLDSTEDLHVFRDILKLEVGDATDLDKSADIDFAQFETIVLNAIEKLETESLPSNDEEDEDISVIKRENKVFVEQFNLRNVQVNVERVHNNEKQMDIYKKALNFYHEWKTNANNVQNWNRKKKRESLITGLQKIKEKHLVIKETPMKSSDVVASSTPKVCKMKSISSDSDSDTKAKKRKKSTDDSDSEAEKTRRKKIKEDDVNESDVNKDEEKKPTLKENEEKKTIVKADEGKDDEEMESNVKSSKDSDSEDEKKKKIKEDNAKDSDVQKDKEKQTTLKENEAKKSVDVKEETKVKKEKKASVKEDEEIDSKVEKDEEKKIKLKEKEVKENKEIEVKENKEIEVNEDKKIEMKKEEIKETEVILDVNKETLDKEVESEVKENNTKEVELQEDEGIEIVKKESVETREAEIEQKSKFEEEEKEGKRKKQEKIEQKKKEEDVEQKKKKAEEEAETKRKREHEEAEKKKKKGRDEKDKEKERERKRAKDKEERKKAKEEERRKEKEKEKKKKEEKYKQMDMKMILEEGSKPAPAGTPSSGSKSHNKHNRHEDKRKEDRNKIKEKLKISSDKFVSSAPGPDLMSNILGRMETERKKNKKKTEKEIQKEMIENHKKRLDDNNYVRDKNIDITIEPEKTEVDIDSNKINNPNSVLSEQEKAVICKAQNVSELSEPVIDSGKVDEDVANSPQDFGGMDGGGMADDDDDGDDFDLDLPAPVPAVLADSSAPALSDRERPSSQLDSRPATLQDKVVDDLTSDDWGVRPGSAGGRSGSSLGRPGSSLGRPGSRNDSEPGDVFSNLPDPVRNRPPTPPPPSVVIPPINLNLSDNSTSRIHDHGRGLGRRSPVHEETRRRRTSGYEEHQSRRNFPYEGSQSRRISGYEESRNRRSMSPTGRDLEDDLSRSPFMEPDSFGGPRTPVAEFTGPSVGPRTPLGEPPKTPAGDTPPHREVSPAPDLPDDYPDDYHSDDSCSPSPPMKIPSRSPSPRAKESSRPPSPFLKPSRSPSPFLKNEKADRNSKPAKPSSRPEPPAPAPVPPPPPPPAEPDDVPKPVPPPIPFEPKAGVKLPSDIDERFAKHFKVKREENKRKKEEEKKKRDEEKRKKESEKKKREDKGRAVAREALQKQRSKAAAENEAYEPSASPLWEARKKSKTDKPAKPKEFDDFDIDTSKSFLDGGKCIPVENVKKVVSEDAAPEKEIAAKLAGAGLGSFLDKIIKGLAKANQNVNNPPLPKKPPPPPPKEAPPPLPVGKPPPLPSEPHPGRKSSKVQHPRELVEDSISVLNVGEDDFDDNMILNIVAELDDSLAEEEKLKKAKEKLTNILLKKKKDSLKAWQGNAKGAQGKKMVMELPGSKPDKSTMGSKPNKSTQKGQLAQYPGLLSEKPPPPPNKSNLTEHDIDSFMTDWGMAESEKANTKKVDESETDSNVGSYSSALAKLRAKKLQQAEEPKPLSNALQKLRRLKSDDGFKHGHGDEVEEDGLRRIKSEDASYRGHGNDQEQDNYRRVKSEGGLKRGHGGDRGNEAGVKRGRRDEGAEGSNESLMEPVDDYYNPSEAGSTISGDQGWENHGRDWGQSSASWYGDQSSGRWSNSKTSDRTNNEGAYAAYGANYGYYGAHNQPYVQHPNQVAYGSQRGGTYKYLQNQQYGRQEDSYSQQSVNSYYNGQYGQRGEQYDPNTGAPWVRTPQMGEYPPPASRGRKSNTWGNEQFPNQGFQSWPGTENTSSRDQTSQSKNGSLTNVQNSSQGVQFGTPGSGEIKEKNYLEKFMFEWDKVLSEDFVRLRHEVDDEIKRQKLKKGDLGSEYDDDRLNMMVKKKNDPQAVEMNIIKKTVTFDVTHLQCQVCNISVYGKRNLDTHLLGKRHEGNMADFVISEPPPSSVAISPSSSVLKHLVKRYRSAALLGLEYVAEVLGDHLDAEYHCLLCDQTSTPQNLMYHLLSVKHRLKYLTLYFKVVGRKFNRVKNVDFWEESSFDLLDTVTSRIEEKYGRGEPTVVASPTIFHKDVAKIRQQMKDAKHIRESIDFNFKTLPDPFGTYQFKIPPEEITELTK